MAKKAKWFIDPTSMDEKLMNRTLKVQRKMKDEDEEITFDSAEMTNHVHKDAIYKIFYKSFLDTLNYD
jgi:hypothetical protein